MKTQELIPAFEAILFASGEPVSIDRLSQVFEIDPQEVVKTVEELEKLYKDRNSGLEIVRMENTYQIATAEKYAEYIRKAFDLRRRTPLSSADFEVLAVVAYNQPVTKAFIEQVRGVDCSGVVSTLIEKGLLEERGRLDLPGKPLIYGTTKNFLRCFGFEDLSQLPPIDKDSNEANDIGEQLEMTDGLLETGEDEEN